MFAVFFQNFQIHNENKHSSPVFRIRIDLNNTDPDPDPAFEINTDPDSDPGFFITKFKELFVFENFNFFSVTNCHKYFD